jgi:hypothetical protein
MSTFFIGKEWEDLVLPIHEPTQRKAMKTILKAMMALKAVLKTRNIIKR